MCTQVYFVVPSGADISAIDSLTERHTVGHGLTDAGGEGPTLFPGEGVYLVSPWKMCHCGWGPRDFARVLSDALDARSTPWLGVFVSEQGETDDRAERIGMSPEEFAEGEWEQDVLYIVERPPAPPITRRHGPRRRRKRAG